MNPVEKATGEGFGRLLDHLRFDARRRQAEDTLGNTGC